MKAKKIISLILVVLIIGISGGILYTNSKYITSAEGRFSADVAKYRFNLSVLNNNGEAQDIANFVLADTSNNKNVANGQIAPGTSGAFDVVVDATGSEVSVDYTVTFENTSGDSLPRNLKMYLDGESWSFDKNIKGSFDIADSETQSRTFHITWEWPYETPNENNSVAASDTVDTLDGLKNLNYSFKVIAVGTQAKAL